MYPVLNTHPKVKKKKHYDIVFNQQNCFFNPEACGIPNANPEKIVGGVEATPHEFPWQVGLFFDGYFCGGTIICKLLLIKMFH